MNASNILSGEIELTPEQYERLLDIGLKFIMADPDFIIQHLLQHYIEGALTDIQSAELQLQLRR